MKLAQSIKLYQDVDNVSLHLTALQMALHTLDDVIRETHPRPEQRGSKYAEAITTIDEQIQIFYYGLLQDMGDTSVNGNYKWMCERVAISREAIGYIKTKIEGIATFFKLNFKIILE